ncbi:MAG: class I SAM-dependent methyltransferase [Chitinophagaceae bacterium]|nr:class I SAM-dependent methyltransferase [Chitinophagaceae bacterium]PZR09021.1 MAG: hypothetical protein DI539_22325 [Flavobacterium psychrophilum]
MKLTTKEFWDASYTQSDFFDQGDHAVADFLNKYLDNGSSKTSLELGSFPGSFLPTIGRKGYRLFGVDYNDRNVNDLPQWLRSQNLAVGEFVSGDLFDFIAKNNQQFDLVCSFGLIEHFENYDELIKLHLSLLKPGGKLIITTPNFRGWLQYWPHKFFDAYNLSKHYVPSMNPGKWKKILIGEGAEVAYAGYFGDYAFWVDREQKRSAINKKLLRVTEWSIFQLRKILWFQSSAFSAFCGIVATKK